MTALMKSRSIEERERQTVRLFSFGWLRFSAADVVAPFFSSFPALESMESAFFNSKAYFELSKSIAVLPTFLPNV